jgi:hypothetical protein
MNWPGPICPGGLGAAYVRVDYVQAGCTGVLQLDRSLTGK